MEEFLPKHGEFFVRSASKASEDGSIFLGFIPEKLTSTKEDEIWLMQFIIVDAKKFKVPRRYAGMRADQILCETFDLKELEEIKPPTK